VVTSSSLHLLHNKQDDQKRGFVLLEKTAVELKLAFKGEYYFEEFLTSGLKKHKQEMQRYSDFVP